MIKIIKNIAGAVSGAAKSVSNRFISRGFFSYAGMSGSYEGTREDEILLDSGYVGNSDVYSIINAISIESNSVNWLLKDSKGEILEDGEAFDILNNDDETPLKEKITQSLINYINTGDLFLYFPEVVGFNYFTEFKVLRSVDVVVNISEMTGEVLGYEYRDGNFRYNIPKENILHIKDYDPTTEGAKLRGLSRFSAGYRVLTAANNREEASSSLWANNGSQGILSDKSGAISTEAEARKLQDAANKKTGGAGNAGGMIVSTGDLSWLPFGFTNKELSIDKTADQHLRKIAALMNVSSRQFNDPKGSTYNNSGIDSENFFIKGVLPLLNKISQHFSLWLKNQGYDAFIYLDLSEVPALAGKRKEKEDSEIKRSEAVSKVLTDNTSNMQKITILHKYHGYTEEEAANIVNDGQEGNSQNQG